MRRSTRADWLDREPEGGVQPARNGAEYILAPPKIQAIVNSRAAQLAREGLERHQRLAPHGMRECPNHPFCRRPIIRKAKTGPWPTECLFCRRTSRRWQKARERAKARGDEIPADVWGPWAKGLEEPWVVTETIERRDRELDEIRSVMGNDNFSSKAPPLFDVDVNDYEERQVSVSKTEEAWLGAWYEISNAWQKAWDGLVDTLMEEIEGKGDKHGHKRLPRQSLSNDGAPFRRKPYGVRITPGDHWLRNPQDEKVHVGHAQRSYESLLRELIQQPGGLAHSPFEDDVRRAMEWLGLDDVSARTRQIPEEREVVDPYEKAAYEVEIGLHPPGAERRKAAKRVADEVAEEIAKELEKDGPDDEDEAARKVAGSLPDDYGTEPDEG